MYSSVISFIRLSIRIAVLGSKPELGSSHNRYFGYAKKNNPKKIELYLIRPHNKKKATIGNGTMITFKANSKKTVNEFYKIGISLGAKDEGMPGPRHGKDYYAYLRDLDGNKICVFKKI
mgnify:CR=1 FL=1